MFPFGQGELKYDSVLYNGNFEKELTHDNLTGTTYQHDGATKQRYFFGVYFAAEDDKGET